MDLMETQIKAVGVGRPRQMLEDERRRFKPGLCPATRLRLMSLAAR
jgi:hypothetical protein